MDFTTYLPEGAKEALLQERITQLATEGLANQIALGEAEQAGDGDGAATFVANIQVITAAITAHELTLTPKEIPAETPTV